MVFHITRITSIHCMYALNPVHNHTHGISVCVSQKLQLHKCIILYVYTTYIDMYCKELYTGRLICYPVKWYIHRCIQIDRYI